MQMFLSWIKKHKIISLIVIVIVVILGTLPHLFSSISTDSSYTVKKQDLVNTVLVNGTYSIAAQTPVVSPTNGVITQLFVHNGDQIKKGDALFHVESSATPEQQKAAYATYLADQAVLQSDKAVLYSLQSVMYRSWKKYTDLATNATYQNGDGSPNTNNRVLTEFTTAQDDWLAAEANFKNQQGVIAKDQAAVASSLQQYNETKSVTITAPLAGQVINLASKTGNQVLAANSTPVLLIANFSNPFLVAAVDQVNIPKLNIGQPAMIVFDALPDQTFHGSIQSIDTIGTKTQGMVTFNVYFSIDQVPVVIKPSMTASITIETARRNQVLTVPNDAIIQKNGQNFLELADGHHTLVPVRLGLQGLLSTEVISGISEGQKIVEQQ